MEVIVTDDQLKRVIPNEHLEFVRSFVQKHKHFPRYRELQYKFAGQNVDSLVPNHPSKDVKIKTYVERELGPYLKPIRALYGDEFDFSREKPKLGEKYIWSLDGKHLLRSPLEALTYNTFILENLEDQIEVDTNKFLKTCHKIPDFVWEQKKIIIEVAGMESEGYKNKLIGAEKCFGDLGYKVIILDARPYEKNNKYIEFYNHICKELGFTPKKEVIESPFHYLGYREITKEEKEKYIQDNIQKFPKDRKTTYTLDKYLNQLYGYGIREYIKRSQLKRYGSSIDKKDIVKFKSENPTMSNSEIAKHFGVHKNTVQTATKGMEGKKNQN